jgi:hypothetical protein
MRMGVRQRTRHLLCNPRHLNDWKWSKAFNPLLKILSAHVLSDDERHTVVFAAVNHRCNVGVSQTSHRRCQIYLTVNDSHVILMPGMK